MPKAAWQEFFRVRTEASFKDNQSTPATTVTEWNLGGIGGGANGWMDLPDKPGYGMELIDDVEKKFPYAPGDFRKQNPRIPG